MIAFVRAKKIGLINLL